MQFAPGDGAGTLTVQVRTAGDASVFPAASVARTSNVCDRFSRPEYAFGDVHDAQAPPSIRHANVEADSEAVNAKLAEPLETVPLGPDEIVVFGAVVSGAGVGCGVGVGSGFASGAGCGCGAGSDVGPGFAGFD